MAFAPPHCPNPACPSRSEGPARLRPRSSFRRKCDGRTVSRFACDRCKKSCSTQTFRLDYRLRRTDLWSALFMSLCSKVTLRQSARFHDCDRKTVSARLKLFGEHCKDLHLRILEQARGKGGIRGSFQLDELETYEHNRRLFPLTVPVLIERKSYFVLWSECAPLPARGGLRPADRTKKEAIEKATGCKRKSGSRAAVARAFELLHRVVPPQGRVRVQTDEKHTYASELKKRFGERVEHRRYSSKAPRVYGSALFPINHTLAMMRDGISRLVRRTWAASKQAVWHQRHQWIWIVWRNYVRGITNAAPETTPAMALGIAGRQLGIAELLAVPRTAPAESAARQAPDSCQGIGPDSPGVDDSGLFA